MLAEDGRLFEFDKVVRNRLVVAVPVSRSWDEDCEMGPWVRLDLGLYE